MALLQKTQVSQSFGRAMGQTARPARVSSVAVRAQQPQQESRRGLLVGLGVGVLGGVAALQAPNAEAIEIPFQKSIGGQGVGGGSMTKSPSTSTAAQYTYEGYPGTKKPSYISPKEKRMMRAEAREKAEKEMMASTAGQ